MSLWPVGTGTRWETLFLFRLMISFSVATFQCALAGGIMTPLKVFGITFDFSLAE